MDDFKMDELDNLEMKFQEVADPKVLSVLDKLGNGIALVVKTIQSTAIKLPTEYQVKGSVNAKITDLPPITIKNFSDTAKYFQALDNRLAQLVQAISLVSSQKPAPIKIDAPKVDVGPITKAIGEIHFPEYSNDNESVTNMLLDVKGVLVEILNRPQMTPNPVSHMSINGLNGSVLTTQIQLGSTVTATPAIPLTNRRSLQLYNNGAGTIYIGGSTVTAANGIPVPSGSYSDIIDAGVHMTLYAISAAGQNNDVRVLEVSDISMGT